MKTWKPILLILPALLSIATGAQTAFGKGIRQATELFNQAEDFFQAGDLDEAFDLYQKIKEQYPGDRAHLLALIRLGRIHLSKKNPTEARAELLTAMKRYPRNDQFNEILIGLAEAEMALKQYALARKRLGQLPTPISRYFPDRVNEILTLSCDAAVALGLKVEAVKIIDEQMSLPDSYSNSNDASVLLEKAKTIVKGMNRRKDLEKLRGVVRNIDIKRWISERLGEFHGAEFLAASDMNPSSSARSIDAKARPLVRAQLRIASLQANSTDVGTGAQASFLSNLTPALSLYFTVPWRRRLHPFAIFEGRYVSFQPLEGRTLNDASQYSLGGTVGLFIFPLKTRRFSVAPVFGVGQHFFFRGLTPSTDITVDKLLIPQAGLQLMFQALQLGLFEIQMEGGGHLVFARTNEFQTVRGGFAYYGRLTGGYPMSPTSMLKLGAVALVSQLETSDEERKDVELGFELALMLSL